ncbi:carboxylesterase [Aspergillus germanicus]
MPAPLQSQAGVETGSISAQINARSEYKGFVSALGVAHFLGVQFARIPARFRQAQLVHPDSHDGVVDATHYGPNCPQPPDAHRTIRQHLFAGTPAANLTQSEFDCLRLNIYAPESAVASPEKIPVLVWIHGGGFTVENGNADFSGDFLVSHIVTAGRPIVFVSVNYRLGLLGFLSSSELAEEAGASGEVGWANQGLHDQRLALQWVNSYIHLFGGDASNVTIAGESAGAWSVLAHLRSDQPLCQRGILQSAPSLCMMSPEEAQGKFDRLLERAGIPATAAAAQKIAALRTVPLADLISWTDPLTTPIWDPKWFVDHASPQEPLDCEEPFPSWVQAIVAGTMRDEMAIFRLDKVWQTRESIVASISAALHLPADPTFSTSVLCEYGIDQAASNEAAAQGFIALLMDACFTRVPFNLAGACRNPGSPSLYIYRFDQPDEEERSGLRGTAFHALDNAYLCRSPAVAGPVAPPTCRATANSFSQMLLRHAYGDAPWHPYSSSGTRYVFDGAQSRLEIANLDAERWNKLLSSEARITKLSALFFQLIINGPGR